MDALRRPRSVSAVLRGADSLGAAAVALARECPYLTIDSLLAAERAEIVELGWEPSRARRDCSHLVTMAALLRPVGAAHGDLSIARALELFIESGHHRAGEIADAMTAADTGSGPAGGAALD